MASGSIVKAILFDVGWTLIYPKPTRRLASEEYLLGLGFRITPDVLDSAYRAAANYYRLHRWQPETVVNIERFWQEYYTIYAERLGIEDPGISAAIQAHAGKTIQYYLYPETEPVLQELRRRGYWVGAVSNWSAQLLEILESLQLTGYLDTIVVSDIVGFHKPQPGIFEHALKYLDVPASAAIHVGDDLEADVEGARRAGIKPIWLDRGSKGHAGQLCRIQSLDEVLPLLTD